MPYQTSTNQYQNTKYIVDAAGGTPYATIQSAINAAQAIGIPATIFIRAGAYAENLTLYNGIEIQGSNAFQTVVTGLHTPPNAGRCALLNLGLASATHILSSAAAGTATIKFSQCTFNLTNGYVCNMANWTGTIIFEFCADNSTINGIVLNTATAAITLNNNTIGKGTANPLTSNGILTIYNSAIGCPTYLSGSAVSVIDGGASFLHTITVSANANLSIANSRISTGTETALITTSSVHVLLSDVNIESTNVLAIDGTGIIQTSMVSFSDSYGVAGTITHALAGLTGMGIGYMTDAVIENLTTPGMLTNDNTGGVGSSATTQYALQIGDAGGQITDLTVGATGEILVGATASNPTWLAAGSAGKVLTSHAAGNAVTWETPSAGGGIGTLAGDSGTATGATVTIAGAGGITTSATGSTVTITGGGGLTWSIKTSDLNPMVVDNGYIANKAGLLTFTLPTTCAAGKVLRVTGMNTAVGWRIAQSANQIIHFGTSTTTTGAGGYIEATNIHDSVELVCCVANLEFIVVSSTGNITIA